MVRVQIVNQVPNPEQQPNNWELYLQWCRYVNNDNGTMERGYRFIWRKPNGNLQPARGQARIVSLEDAERLIEMARNEGWGDYTGD